ncbi:SRPBCC family protein [Nonomuraea recticatena]
MVLIAFGNPSETTLRLLSEAVTPSPRASAGLGVGAAWAARACETAIDVTSYHRRMIELQEDGEIACPAVLVWAVVADYGQDPRWRKGVKTMAPRPEGIVQVGTTTAEVMRFAGRTYRNGGEVIQVEPGRYGRT